VLFFKHVDGIDCFELGCIGFPETQSARSALRIHHPLDDFVLLALPRIPQRSEPYLWHGCNQRIFGIGKLLNFARSMSELGNPTILKRESHLVSQWPTAAPLFRFWRLDEPKDYTDDPKLAVIVTKKRGHLIPLPSEAHSNINTWFQTAAGKMVPCYTSPLLSCDKTVQEFMQRLDKCPPPPRCSP